MSLHHDPDVLLAKLSTIRRCVATVREVRRNERELEAWIVEDLTVLNLSRAIEACIDLANHLLAANSWELPRDARDAFSILARRGVVTPELERPLVGMAGFRNVAVHQYRDLDPAIVEAAADAGLADLERFATAVAEATRPPAGDDHAHP